MTRLLECDHVWDPVQRCWRPSKRMNGVTPAFRASPFTATRVVSTVRNRRNEAGEIAALDTAFRLKAMTRSGRARASTPIRRRLLRERAVRPFLDSLFTPSRDFYLPADDTTLVCRCEEIAAGQIRREASGGASAPTGEGQPVGAWGPARVGGPGSRSPRSLRTSPGFRSRKPGIYSSTPFEAGPVRGFGKYGKQ